MLKITRFSTYIPHLIRTFQTRHPPFTRTLTLNLTRFFFSLQTLNRLHSTDSTSSLLSTESTFAAGVAGAAGVAFSARCARTWCGWKAHLGSPVCSVASVPTATVVGEGRRGGGGKNDGTEYNRYLSSPGFTKKGALSLSFSTDLAEGGRKRGNAIRARSQSLGRRSS